jgi:hypothetical protein
VRKNFGPLHEVVHSYAFAYFLYQLQSVAIVSSIFTTTVLALERCLAVAKPIEYHNAVQVKKISLMNSNTKSLIHKAHLGKFQSF